MFLDSLDDTYNSIEPEPKQKAKKNNDEKIGIVSLILIMAFAIYIIWTIIDAYVYGYLPLDPALGGTDAFHETEFILQYCREHASDLNPVQDLVDKLIITWGWFNGETCTTVKQFHDAFQKNEGKVGTPLDAQPVTSLKSDLQNRLNIELSNPSNKISDHAVLLIYSDTSWSGSILDSGFDSATRDGSGDAKIPILCQSYGIYSLVLQKQSSSGYLLAAIIQDGKLLDAKSTSAEYGLVSLSGNCL